MFKPMFETDGYKPSVKKYTPTPGRVQPKESNLLHRQGESVKNADGRVIGRKGENIRTQRHSVCGLRDKMALASSSAKVSRFVNANGHTDRGLDTPPPTAIGMHIPKAVRGRRMPKPCRRAD